MSDENEDLVVEDPARVPDEPTIESEQDTDLPENGAQAAEESAQPSDDEPKPSKVDRRIAQLTARAHRAEREREMLRGKLEVYTSQQSPEPELKEPTAPDPTAFNGDFEQFAAAQTKYIADLRQYDRDKAASQAEADKRTTEATGATEKQQRQRDWFEKGTETHDDFDLVVADAGTPCTQAMLDVAEKLETGHDVLYRVMSDPAKAIELSAMSATEVALEMAKMAQAPPRKGNGKPPPTPPNPARGRGDKATVDDDDLSTADAIKRDRERRASLGRA